MTAALERVNAMRATVNAIGLAFSKEGAPLPDGVREDLTAARLEA